MQPPVEIPDCIPREHLENYRPTEYKYGYCTSCESLFLLENYLVSTCFNCNSIIIVKDMKPPYILSVGDGNALCFTPVYNEDGLPVVGIRQFPVEAWEYQYVVGSMLGPNDLEWYKK